MRAASQLRPADVEVRLARALYFLQLGQFEEVRNETTPVLELDSSYRAHYYRGVACSRLRYWACASAMLEQVQASDKAVWFEGLALELGVVRLYQERWEDARVLLLEASQTPLTGEEARVYLAQLEKQGATEPLASQLLGSERPPTGPPEEARNLFRGWVGLASGFDSNISGLVNEWGLSCEPNEVGSEEMPRSCGPMVSERFGARFMLRKKGGTAHASYAFQHRWYPNVAPMWTKSAQHLFDVQHHGLALGVVAPRPDISIFYRLDLESLNQKYRPLYYLGNQALLRYRRAGRIDWWVEYRAVLDQFGNLAGIWNFAPQDLEGCAIDAGVSDAGVSDTVQRTCVRGQDGWRHQVRLTARHRERTWSIGAKLAAEYLDPNDPVFRGLQLEARLSGTAQLTSRLRLNGESGSTYRRYTNPLGLGVVRQLYPLVGLSYRLTNELKMTFAYQMNWSRLTTPPDEASGGDSKGSGYIIDYVRHTALVEMLYVL